MTVDRITQITCHHAIRDEESDKAKGCKQVPGSLEGCEAFPELIEWELNYIPDQRGPKLRGVSWFQVANCSDTLLTGLSGNGRDERQLLVLLMVTMVTMVIILRNKPQVTVIAAMMRRR